MITGELKSKVDAIWNAMWSGGIANPMQVVEQLTYLLFIKRLDELHTLREKKASRLGTAIEDPVFPDGSNPATTSGTSAQDLRWSRFRDLAPETLFNLLRDEVFPFIKNIGGAESRYASHMKGALFIMPTPRLLAYVVDRLDELPMHDRDLKGDVYEYMLGKIASAGQNGQFRTPRHIIKLMVDMTAPTPADVICDPACGDDLVIQKLRHREALTQMDLGELQNVLIEQGGEKGEDLLNQLLSEQGQNVAEFARSIVGLDRKAASEPFARFLDQANFNARQIRFVEMIVDFVTRNGKLEAKQLYDTPFTDDGLVESIFPDEQDADAIFELVKEVSRVKVG